MDPDELKRRSRGISGDMSPAAIARRIDIVGQLHEVWQLLRTARRIGPVTPSTEVAERTDEEYRGGTPRSDS